MKPEQVKALITQMIQQNNAFSRYQLTPVQTHTHDGINSPNVFQPILTYVGLIGSDGTPILLPTGWSVVKDSGAGDGIYYITHNLGTILYSCVASAAQSTNIYAVPVIEGFENEVDFSWADVATAAKADTGFFFTLTVVNNKKTTLPSYYGTYVQ